MPRTAVAALVFAAVAAPTFAQTPPAEIGSRYVPAPWWMREPVIASIGYVRTEAPANRASFGAAFQTVKATAPEATAAAADQVRSLADQLRAFGADKVRVEATLSIRPLYDQYRDKDGNVLENQRADKIDKYEANANLRIEVRDVSLLERVYATVAVAKPSSLQPVSFRFDPENVTKTWLANEAVKDAARRAREAAAGAGAKLGGVKVIDPTGRACQTDVLAGWPSYGSSGRSTTVDYEPSAVAYAPPPPPPAPPSAERSRSKSLTAEDLKLPLNPPLVELTDQACVVYGLG